MDKIKELIKYIDDEKKVVEEQIQIDILAGNIVNEEYWRGESMGLHKVFLKTLTLLDKKEV